MSSLSQLSNWQPATRHAAPTTARSINPVLARLDAAAAAQPSTIVTLSPEAIAAASAPLTTSQRYRDVGAEMLKQLGTGSVIPLEHAKLPEDVDNRFTLSIATKNGARVDLTLADVDGEMIYQVGSSAELNDDERKAMSDLAKGFQAAIDGMTGSSPAVRIGGLTQFDSKLVQSIDFHAEVAGPDSTTQTLDFHIDEAMRKVSVAGADGKAEVNVDTSTMEHAGTKQQQSKAISSYLAQFDQAVARGHGDKKLMSMFKDAFSDLNRTAIAESREDFLTKPSKWQLNSGDRSALTGLSDFSASVSQTPKSSNPRKDWEKDTFSYVVSQETRIDGTSHEDRKIAQSQQSQLSAKYHADVGKSSPPFFDGTLETQNYDYHQIEDSARSDVSVNYRLGKLKSASLQQMASQSEQVQTFILGKLKSEKAIPGQQSLVRDLLPALTSYESIKGDDALDGNTLLLGLPGELVARSEQF